MGFFAKKVERYEIPVKKYDLAIDGYVLSSLIENIETDQSELRLMSLEEFTKEIEETNGSTSSK